ncbi:Polycomb protein Asx [Amphibalanus amphitrite]|uniref:Polycomb protein Asx n=1 Tax=Amphibalanus amphitrite TaxID=1232801 RepID=A0A6A4VDW1_AMPAM|nr:Polycomb protein Asx [Amphibalanus amphitrite]
METEPRLPEKRRRRATGQEPVSAPAPLSVRQLQVAPPAAPAAPATATHSAAGGEPLVIRTPAGTEATSKMQQILRALGRRPRQRRARKLSNAAQLKQTQEGVIDLETPDSILTRVQVKSLLSRSAFCRLPSLYQLQLAKMLPDADGPSGSDGTMKLGGASLNNEFLARACQQWQERLRRGEFTHENQHKYRADVDMMRRRLDPWKARNFEPVWGRRPRRSGSPVTRDAQSVLGTALPPVPAAAAAAVLPAAAAATTAPAAVPVSAAAASSTASGSAAAPSVPEVKPKRSWATPPPESAERTAGAEDEEWSSPNDVSLESTTCEVGGEQGTEEEPPAAEAAAEPVTVELQTAAGRPPDRPTSPAEQEDGEEGEDEDEEEEQRVRPALAVSAGQPQPVAVAGTLPLPATAGAQPRPQTSAAPAAQLRTKGKGRGQAGKAGKAARPPAGTVNLERSYQICQAVINKSQNRAQLQAQLKPLPALLAERGGPAGRRSAAPSAAAAAVSAAPHAMQVKYVQVPGQKVFTATRVVAMPAAGGGGHAATPPPAAPPGAVTVSQEQAAPLVLGELGENGTVVLRKDLLVRGKQKVYQVRLPTARACADRLGFWAYGDLLASVFQLPSFSQMFLKEQRTLIPNIQLLPLCNTF